MINRDRLAETFKSLVEMDSVSREEGPFAEKLRQILESMGAQTSVDDAGKEIGGNAGNLFARFKGNLYVAGSKGANSVLGGLGGAKVFRMKE